MAIIVWLDSCNEYNNIGICKLPYKNINAFTSRNITHMYTVQRENLVAMMLAEVKVNILARKFGNKSTNRLLIVTTNSDGFSLANP